MLSKVEVEFLKSPENFSADYARVLRHRIRAKSAQLRSELVLLNGSFGVTENCNGVTEFSNGQQDQQNLNQAGLSNRSAEDGIRTHAERMFHGLSRPAR